MLIAPRFHFPLPFFESSACEKLHSPWSLRSLLASMCLACVASVSARVRREKLGREQKKKEWRGRGRGRRKKETLARKPLACEQQTYFRSSLLSVRKREGQKRRPEVRLLFAGKQTPRFWKKLRSPTNAASDWWGAGIVDYLALETSIKPGMLCLRALQIWLHLICSRRLLG